MFFGSDNWAGAAPEIVEAVARANNDYAPAYGDDALTRQLTQRFNEVFETECSVFLVATGGAANGLALSVLTPPYGAVLCQDGSHVQTDECGGPEFFTGGAKLVGVPGQLGKFDRDALQTSLEQFPNHPPHSPVFSAVSLTQGTECGTLYSTDEIAAISEFAHSREMAVHMDGARFANAVAGSDCSAADLTWRAGVDVLSFGGTKNGCMAAEAVVFFNPALVRDFEHRRKRAGQLFSKMRFVAAQFDAYLTDDLWLRLAGHANGMAQRLSTGLAALTDVQISYPTEINEVFATMAPTKSEAMRKAGAVFFPWVLPGDEAGGHMNRMIASFRTSVEEVDAFLALASATV